MKEILTIIENVIIYLLIVIPALLLVHFSGKVHKIIFRKLLHLAALGLILCLIYSCDEYLYPLIVCIIGAILIYPVLALFEKCDWYSTLLVEKKKGEIKSSLLQLFGCQAVMILLFWGLLDKKYIVIASLLMWSLGDAAAAIVGGFYGKHKVNLKLADHHKSYEGSLSMWLISTLAGLFILLFVAQHSLGKALIETLVTGLAASYVELITHDGYDTFTVVFACAAVLYLFALI